MVGAGVAASALAGCGDDDDALTFFFKAVPDEAMARMRVIEEFQRLHPDIKIRVIPGGLDVQQQVMTYCSGGKCPDVLMVWELRYAALARLGVLLDLNTMLAAEPAYAGRLKLDSYPTLYDTFTFRGGQYALPEQWSGIFVYYNKELFAEAGLSSPPARWSDVWSFTEFLDTARALTKRDRSGVITQWGVVDAWTPYWTAGCFGMNNGVDWFSPPLAPTRSNIDDDRFIEGFQFYADLSVRHRVAPRGDDEQQITAQSLFAQGKAGMAIVGHWMYSTFIKQPGLDFDVTVLPVGPRGVRARSDVGTTGLAIAADSPRRAQAWEFVKFATGPVGQQIIADSGLFVPVLKSVTSSPGFAHAHKRIRNLEVLTEGPNNSHYIAVTPAWSQIDAVFRRGAEHVMRGAATADWFTHGVAGDINDLLKT
jgi:multiple sugar transport system substrate-binding protein